MRLRLSKKYHPYPRECQGLPHAIVHLRYNRTYQRCSHDRHPNHHRHQRARTRGRVPLQQLQPPNEIIGTSPRPPPALPLEIMNAIFRELLINSDIPLDALTSNLLVCRTWNTIVSGLVCRDTNVQRKLILIALKSKESMQWKR